LTNINRLSDDIFGQLSCDNKRHDISIHFTETCDVLLTLVQECTMMRSPHYVFKFSGSRNVALVSSLLFTAVKFNSLLVSRTEKQLGHFTYTCAFYSLQAFA